MDGIEFLATRKTLGLSRRDCARHLGVTERTVSRWESDAGRYPVPAGAAETLTRDLDAMADGVRSIVSAAEGTATPVELPYYRSQGQYDGSHPSGGVAGMANGLSSAAYLALRMAGLPCRWVDGA